MWSDRPPIIQTGTCDPSGWISYRFVIMLPGRMPACPVSSDVIMSARTDLFSTPLLTARPPDADGLCTALKAAIDERRKSNVGLERSNLGGWHSSADMTAWGGEAARSLAEFAVAEVSPHMIDIARRGKRDFNWGVEMWANVNRPGDANQLHCHPAAYWSGVFYVDPGGAEDEAGGGELVFEDPRYPMAYMAVPDLVLKDADGSAMASQYQVRPEAGMLVLFPAWLRHSVRPHAGSRERISVALNLLLTDARRGRAGPPGA